MSSIREKSRENVQTRCIEAEKALLKKSNRKT